MILRLEAMGQSVPSVLFLLQQSVCDNHVGARCVTASYVFCELINPILANSAHVALIILKSNAWPTLHTAVN